MDTIERVDQLVGRLARAPVPADVYNQYAFGPQVNAVCRQNLTLYLRQMAARKPDVLLVGEAAGYRGCRLTGIPFTSEFILAQGVRAHNLFGSQTGYCAPLPDASPVKEATATMVWEVLSELRRPPLLWNALPFHPHRPDRLNSNRTPRRRDLALGRQFLSLIQDTFAPNTIIAVGNKASESLRRWNVPHDRVRHPSHGGKADFRKGLCSLLS
ncbi:MAG TPA: uracil-DNA glycosylase [Candidatus Sulfomarinibacteraceae bacterium]|nr:uracil-DNA glycosylase [Candidatus Sulfomarinibacteraceae bacterium]